MTNRDEGGVSSSSSTSSSSSAEAAMTAGVTGCGGERECLGHPKREPRRGGGQGTSPCRQGSCVFRSGVFFAAPLCRVSPPRLGGIAAAPGGRQPRPAVRPATPLLVGEAALPGDVPTASAYHERHRGTGPSEPHGSHRHVGTAPGGSGRADRERGLPGGPMSVGGDPPYFVVYGRGSPSETRPRRPTSPY